MESPTLETSKKQPESPVVETKGKSEEIELKVSKRNFKIQPLIYFINFSQHQKEELYL
jgi:hypothetical protein